MRIPGLFRVLPTTLLLAGFAGACSSPSDASGGGESDITGAAVTDAQRAFWGDDRIGAALKDHPELMPRNFGEYEQLFKMGRQCARTDSKEVFIVQEKQTRTQSASQSTATVLPRAVVTGCNTVQPATNASLRNSYSLMAALISDDSSAAPDPANGDTMLTNFVETMALDSTTGEYNFYRFNENQDPAAPRNVVRVMRDSKGVVTQRTLTLGSDPTAAEPPPNGLGDRCFGCHVNGAPLMNEMFDPWINWVSAHNRFPSVKLSGDTLSLVSEAAADLNHQNRASLAQDLQAIIQAGIVTTINGTSGGAPGLGARVISGAAPGGLPRLLQAALCQSELNYISTLDALPLQAFFDPQTVAAAAFVPPESASDKLPFQLPVQSWADRQIGLFLRHSNFLTLNTLSALRLVDDKNDVFSPLRCGVATDLASTALDVTNPASVDAAVRQNLKTKLEASTFFDVTAQPARKSYLEALIDPTSAATTISSTQQAYFTEAGTRFTAAASAYSGGDESAVQAVTGARKQGACTLFQGGGPMPLLTSDGSTVCN